MKHSAILYFTRAHLNNSDYVLPEYDLFCIMVCGLVFCDMICAFARTYSPYCKEKVVFRDCLAHTLRRKFLIESSLCMDVTRGEMEIQESRH